VPRIFVAVPLPSDLARTVAALVPVHPALRRVDPARLHFTLAFIGSLPEERLADAVGAATAAAQGARAFTVPLDEVGRFPPSGPQRVVWAGSSDPAAGSRIVELGAAVRAQLARRSVPFDAKPLLPHVTLARVRDSATREDLRAIREALASVRVPPGLSFAARTVHVMESVLRSTGPRYTARATIELRPG
jgi:2'-5' RNA ligase